MIKVFNLKLNDYFNFDLKSTHHILCLKEVTLVKANSLLDIECLMDLYNLWFKDTFRYIFDTLLTVFIIYASWLASQTIPEIPFPKSVCEQK